MKKTIQKDVETLIETLREKSKDSSGMVDYAEYAGKLCALLSVSATSGFIETVQTAIKQFN